MIVKCGHALEDDDVETTTTGICPDCGNHCRLLSGCVAGFCWRPSEAVELDCDSDAIRDATQIWVGAYDAAFGTEESTAFFNGEIEEIETFAIGRRIHEVKRLRKKYGRGRWRKRKGLATVRLSDGAVAQAELHWYEATGIGRRELKIKRYLD